MQVQESSRATNTTVEPRRLQTGHVQEVLRQAEQELRQLLQQRIEVMRRIGTVKQTIAGLANLFGDDVLSDDLLELLDRKNNRRHPGFTKACRATLMQANRPLSAREVCVSLQQTSAELLSRHKDPMASVTTVLNRLVGYGEVTAVSLDNGRRAWLWTSDSAPDSASGVATSSRQSIKQPHPISDSCFLLPG